MARRILGFSRKGEDILINFDLATTVEDRQKLANTIYEVLAAYGLEYSVQEHNKSTFKLAGLGEVDYWENVCSDVYDYFVTWYQDDRESVV